jgi:hypothetical protein
MQMKIKGREEKSDTTPTGYWDRARAHWKTPDFKLTMLFVVLPVGTPLGLLIPAWFIALIVWLAKGRPAFTARMATIIACCCVTTATLTFHAIALYGISIQEQIKQQQPWLQDKIVSGAPKQFTCPTTFSAPTMSFNDLIALTEYKCNVPEKITIAVIGREDFPFRQRSVLRRAHIEGFVKKCEREPAWPRNAAEYVHRICGCMAEVNADNITGDDFLAEAEHRPQTYHAEMLVHQEVQECDRREKELRRATGQ